MTRFRLLLPAAFALVFPLSASAQPSSATTQDIWSAALLEGSQAGYVHTRISKSGPGEKEIFHTITELNLTIRRNGQIVQLRMDTSSDETADGNVIAVSMTQYQDHHPQVTMTGTVQGAGLELRIKGMARMIPWNAKVLGLRGQEIYFQEHRAKPGDRFAFLSFEPTIASLVRNQVAVGSYEEVQIPLRSKKRLLRVESTPDKISSGRGDVQLPSLISWIDDDGFTHLSEFEIPSIGKLVLFRTTEAVAKAPRQPAQLTSMIHLHRSIVDPNNRSVIVYRITVKGEKNPASSFVSDARQRPSDAVGSTFSMQVSAYPIPIATAEAAPVSEEYLKSCYFIDSNHPEIKALTRKAVGYATDPWRKALLIESWVHNHMRVGFSESFCPASTVASTLRGDCRQHALLAAAMCRAAGVPARTAIGLCYAEDKTGGPAMAFHMWTEVFVQGQWTGIDATRGQGRVGATHVKITDSSWSDTQSLAPLLPVIRVLGKLSMSVESVD